MKMKLWGLVALLALLNVNHAGATTFKLVNLQIGSDAVTGTITTDGTPGALSQMDITSWNLIINSGSGAVLLVGPPGSLANYTGTALTENSTNLFFNYSLSTDSFFEIGATSGPNKNLVLADVDHFTGAQLEFSDGTVSQTSSSESGNTIIGDTASVTPLPAALPLFATGLGALGLFGWWKKRKATPIAA